MGSSVQSFSSSKLALYFLWLSPRYSPFDSQPLNVILTKQCPRQEGWAGDCPCHLFFYKLGTNKFLRRRDRKDILRAPWPKLHYMPFPTPGIDAGAWELSRSVVLKVWSPEQQQQLTAINLLEMHVVGPLPSPTDLETLGLRSNNML